MKGLLEKMKDEVSKAGYEVEKFENGNKSAGSRARKSLQEIKKLAQELRLKIQEIKNGGK